MYIGFSDVGNGIGVVAWGRIGVGRLPLLEKNNRDIVLKVKKILGNKMA